MLRRQQMIEVYGWYGVAAVIAAYTLLNVHKLPPTSLWYISLNITGGFGLMIDNITHKAYQSTVANAVWFVVGLYALAKILFFF